jgi:SNF family Na+-dependent transporter
MGSASTRREKCVKEGFYSVSSGLSRGIDRVVLILLGLVCYMTTKIIIYYFLVEKAVSTS